MKKMRLLLGTAACVALLFGACKNSKYEGYEQSENGLYYKMISVVGSKPKIKQGDIITLNLNYTTIKDSLLFESSKLGRPFMIKVDKSEFKGDLTEGFKMLSEGDSASFILSADSFFVKTAKRDLPKEITKGSDLKFYLKVLKVETEEKFKAAQQKAQDEQMKAAEASKSMEDSLIKKYVIEKNITAKPNASGIYITETKKGSGALVTKGDTIEVKYTGKFLDGKVFDSSDNSPVPVKFAIGVGMVIAGWDEAIVGMKTGTKATLLIPSAKAYGGMSTGPIPAYSPLVFDIEIVGLTKGKK
jgi:FKBP-type peptidyl-prolyl cis-trans isomerase